MKLLVRSKVLCYHDQSSAMARLDDLQVVLHDRAALQSTRRRPSGTPARLGMEAVDYCAYESGLRSGGDIEEKCQQLTYEASAIRLDLNIIMSIGTFASCS